LVLITILVFSHLSRRERRLGFSSIPPGGGIGFATGYISSLAEEAQAFGSWLLANAP
jgi:hypothetical protein